MININQTSEQTKILIPRSNINGDIEKNNYVTEDELQEILKEYNSIPYIVVDGFSHSSFKITKGDWDAVHNAIQNDKPSLIYARSAEYGKIFSLVDDINPHPQGGASIATTLIVADRKVTYRAWSIDINGNVELMIEQTYTIQPKLVSGENIKTINGNDILGEGDIIIESGGNIVELTQEEYDNTTPEPDTLYVITDAPAVEIPDTSNFVDKETLTYEIDAINIALNQKQDTLVSGQNIKTINNQSIVGSGNITIESGSGNIVELTQSEYNSITPEPDTLYLISDSNINTSLKTINGETIIGSGNITIEGGSGSEPLYLWKALGNMGDGPHMQENLQVRNLLLSLKSSEEYPIVILKDYYNDTICNNIYVSTDYVEIQCCNSRISGTSNELTDERYELASDGSLQNVKNDVVATQNYVDEQIGNINNVLENIIG